MGPPSHTKHYHTPKHCDKHVSMVLAIWRQDCGRSSSSAELDVVLTKFFTTLLIMSIITAVIEFASPYAYSHRHHPHHNRHITTTITSPHHHHYHITHHHHHHITHRHAVAQGSCRQDIVAMDPAMCQLCVYGGPGRACDLLGTK